MKLESKDCTKQVMHEMRGGKGSVTILHLGTGDALPKHCRLHTQITMPPGASIGYHIHENETEIFHFLQGKGLVNDNGEMSTVEAGDILTTASGMGHSVENTSDENLVFDAVIVLD